MNANLYDPRLAENSKNYNKDIQKKKEELQIKIHENEILENLKNLVGPSFIFCIYICSYLTIKLYFSMKYPFRKKLIIFYSV
jgi:hypothetical protein